jgi:hypothetical protein
MNIFTRKACFIALLVVFFASNLSAQDKKFSLQINPLQYFGLYQARLYFNILMLLTM